MRPRSHVNPGVECVRAGDRAFSLRPILSEFAVGYFIPAWEEEEARELQSSVKLNGGNKFWAISGQWALAPPGQSCTPRQYSYLSTVIARYLPTVITVCGRNCKYSTLWLSWLRPRRRWAWLESIELLLRRSQTREDQDFFRSKRDHMRFKGTKESFHWAPPLQRCSLLKASIRVPHDVLTKV